MDDKSKEPTGMLINFNQLFMVNLFYSEHVAFIRSTKFWHIVQQVYQDIIQMMIAVCGRNM
jgi:hypothetical protein